MVANRQSSTVTIDLNDVSEFDDALAQDIINNTNRFKEVFASAIDEVKPESSGNAPLDQTVLDIFIEYDGLLYFFRPPPVHNASTLHPHSSFLR